MHKKGVFIIESLNFSDEKAERYEGKFLSKILHLGGIPSEYYYIRTQIELEKVLEIFEKTEYRYLHLSCHGSEKSIETTIDSISFTEFADIITPYLDYKRLFVSACSAAKKELANEIFPYCKCYSLIGFDKEIYFNDAAITWASFYHLILKSDKMKFDNISPIVKKLSELFEVPINFFQASKSRKDKFQLKQFRNQKASKTEVENET